MIDLAGVEFAYRRQRPLFQNLDLSLPAGTICGLLGANAAGKSTLLRLLAGLSFPQKGRCEVLGQEPAQRHSGFLADVFLLPEEIWLPALSAEQYVARYSPLYPRFSATALAELLREFDLPAYARLPSLSHGQKKKFLLAFGLAAGTSLCIFDEPTNGLDIPGKQQFRRAVMRHFGPDRSFIISTHQVHDLQGLIDSVMILASGRLLLHEPLERLGACLRMDVEAEQPRDAIHYEETLEGFRVLRANTSGEEGPVDLELLFGSMQAKPQVVRSLLAAAPRQEVA